MENLEVSQAVLTEINKLFEMSTTFIASDMPMRKMEMDILHQLLRIGRSFLEHIVEEKLVQLEEQDFDINPKIEHKNTGGKTRNYLSLFGEMTICRPTMLTELAGNIFKLDELLQLPKGTKLSYTLQELIGENASENDFRESVRMLNKLLNLNLSAKTSARNADHLGSIVDRYYEHKPADTEEDNVCFSASFDGKGVPKIKDTKEQKANPKARKGKGEKDGTMQMATVSVTSSFKPKERSVEAVIRGLMGSGLSKVEPDEKAIKTKPINDNRWHKKIHRRAFLADQQKAVDYGILDIKRRMKNPKSRFVVPIDAGIGLEEKVLASVKAHGLESQFDGIILDIIHISEYVWKVGTAYFGEKSDKRSVWVKQTLTDILNSKTDQVIESFKVLKSKARLSKNKKDQIQKSITYFSNHKHKMDYKTFIEKGYPVSSALVESTCGHLVKERMEQSGMRWSSIGAQNIMDLRAVKLNEDVEGFMKFVIQEERKLEIRRAA